MTISFDKDRALHPQLWNGCLRAFNPAGMYGRSLFVSGTIPDYASGRNASTVDGSADGLHIRKGTYKGSYCTDHNGPVSHHITFPDTGLPSGSTAQVSISIWINPTGVDFSSGFSCAISYGDVRAGGVGSYYKAVRIGVIAEGIICGVYATDIVTAWPIPSNHWVHVVLTLSGTSAKQYINGKLVASGTLAGSNITLWGTGYIGAMNDFGMRYPFNGYIGTSAIYNRILSDSEIQLLASDQQVMYEQKRTKILSLSTANFNHTVTGGLALSGNSIAKINFKHTTTGGLALSGNSIAKINFKHTTTGSVIVYGNSGTNCDFIDTDYEIKFYSSPILVFGLTLPTANLSYETTGGLNLDGTSTNSIKLEFNPSSGLTLSNSALTNYKKKYNVNASGELILSNSALTSYVSDLHRYVASGNLILSGTPLLKLRVRYINPGSLTLYGASGTNCDFIDTDYEIKFYSSPILVFGTTLPTANLSYVTTGGLNLDGTSTNSIKFDYNPNDGMILSGSALTSYKKKYNVNASGELILSNSALTSYVSDLHRYVASGNLTLSGTPLLKLRVRYINPGSLTLYGASGTTFNFIPTDYGVKFYSSPILIFGITLPTANLSYVTTGGLNLDGTSTNLVKFNFKDSFNSGLTLLGSSLVDYKVKYKINSNGSLILSDTALANYFTNNSYTSTGGLILSDTALTSYFTKYIYDSNGELILSDTALTSYFTKYIYDSSGELVLAGDYLMGYYYTLTGGLTLSSSSSSRLALNAPFTGGLTLSGTPIYRKSVNYTSTGELVLSDYAAYRILSEYRYYPLTGLELSGEFSSKLGFRLTSLGGLIFSGVSLSSIKAKYSTQFTGNLILSGDSLQNYTRNYRHLPLGNLILSDSSLQKYSVIYNVFGDGVLLLGDNSLYEYSVNYGGLGSILDLRLMGKARNKKREVIKNYSYIENDTVSVDNVVTGDLILVSTKKHDRYLTWKIRDGVVKSNF